MAEGYQLPRGLSVRGSGGRDRGSGARYEGADGETSSGRCDRPPTFSVTAAGCVDQFLNY
jgi:hypothetical protein